MAAFCFWAATLLLLHTYFLYPLLLIAWDSVQQVAANLRRLAGGAAVSTVASAETLPTITLVVAARTVRRTQPRRSSSSAGIRG
jgi:hypothetical protein